MDMKKIVAAVAMAMAGSAYAAQHDTAASTSTAANDPAAQAQTQSVDGAAKVRELQQRLKDQGHDPGPIDGIMGPRTQAALDASQQGQASVSPSAAAESPSFGPAAPPPATDPNPAQSTTDTSQQQPKN